MSSGSIPRPLSAPAGPVTTTCNRIRVCVRVRPMNQKESASQSNMIALLPPNVIIYDPNDEIAGNRARYGLSRRSREMRYAFDRVFGESTLQDDMYEGSAKPLVQSVLQGYNCSVFAYGATGAGKTHTMMGNDVSGRGIMYRMLEDIFHEFENNQERAYSMTLSYLEVYNEQIRDLLATGTDKGKSLELREIKNNIEIPGLSKHHPTTIEEVFSLLSRGGQNRVAAETKANSVSSRSHAVLIVEILGKDPTAICSTTLSSKLCLVDLAGSERASVADNKGVRLREGAKINTSLLALGNCINALTTNAVHIPYRQSKLTQLLKDSLGGTAQTVMIANISPASGNAEESHNTLKYANRAKEIRVVIKKNENLVQQHVSQYQAIIEQLKEENISLKSQVQTLQDTPVIEENNAHLSTFSQLRGRIAQYQQERCQNAVELGRQRTIIEETTLYITERISEEEVFRAQTPEAQQQQLSVRLQATPTVLHDANQRRKAAQEKLVVVELAKTRLIEEEMILRRQINRDMPSGDLKSALISLLDGAVSSCEAEDARQALLISTRRTHHAHKRISTLQDSIPELGRMMELLWKVCHSEIELDSYVHLEYAQALQILNNVRVEFAREKKEVEEIPPQQEALLAEMNEREKINSIQSQSPQLFTPRSAVRCPIRIHSPLARGSPTPEHPPAPSTGDSLVCPSPNKILNSPFRFQTPSLPSELETAQPDDTNLVFTNPFGASQLNPQHEPFGEVTIDDETDLVELQPDFAQPTERVSSPQPNEEETVEMLFDVQTEPQNEKQQDLHDFEEALLTPESPVRTVPQKQKEPSSSSFSFDTNPSFPQHSSQPPPSTSVSRKRSSTMLPPRCPGERTEGKMERSGSASTLIKRQPSPCPKPNKQERMKGGVNGEKNTTQPKVQQQRPNSARPTVFLSLVNQPTLNRQNPRDTNSTSRKENANGTTNTSMNRVGGREKSSTKDLLDKLETIQNQFEMQKRLSNTKC